jgi:hypothetical protein
MAAKKWDKKPPGDTQWERARSLGGYIATSFDEDFDEQNAIPGLNPYSGAMRLVGGADADEALWVDQIQGYRRPRMQWSHNSVPHTIERCARIPYLIKARDGAKKRAYLDHLLVGYSDSGTTVPASTTLFDWTALYTGDAGAGDSRELGTFLLEDLWHSTTTPPKAIQYWWRPVTADPHGYDKVSYTTTPSWEFRDRSMPVFGSVRIRIADSSRRIWNLLVGYEGGGGW